VDVRDSINKMRNLKNGILETEKKKDIKPKDLSMRDMLKITRKINENITVSTKVTPAEQREEEEKFRNFFRDNQVHVDFEPLELYDDSVFWSGVIDNQLQFIYKVSPVEEANGFSVNYLEGFDQQDEENQEVVKKIEKYYDEFYKYWRDNYLDTKDESKFR
jgi:hypothetical protein